MAVNPLRYFWRVAQVGVVTALFALAFVLGLPLGRPRLLRWYFQTCGHGFVKLGQVLAMRYDLLPMAYCEALASLLDQMPTVPLAKLLTIIERDLGRPWPEIYRHIDSEALGSASIAQVHGAELVDGRRVVIKVLRPHSRTYFRIDFFNARLFARFFDSLGLIPSLNLRLLTEEVIQLTEEELDFRREAQNIDLLHRQLESDGLAHTVPQVVPQGCGEQVVTMERMDGIWLKDVLVADPADLPSNLDRERLAALLFESILVQIFRHRLFHADPHAANILIRPDGSLGYVDFGLVGWVDEKVWEQQARLYQAIGQEQVQAAYDAILDSMQPLPALDLTDFEREVKALLHDWIA
ncbi:MAG: AarF/ABC1/UbiB kinase family protein, partial [Anaerolineae bacterium]|nr:AarF/ABC1/UbiB kinase family protein [Anaerolineae bacterium]